MRAPALLRHGQNSCGAKIRFSRASQATNARLGAAQQHGPFDVAVPLTAVADPLSVGAACEFAAGNCDVPARGRHGVQLRLRGPLKHMHQHEGFGHAAADGKRAMIFEDQAVEDGPD